MLQESACESFESGTDKRAAQVPDKWDWLALSLLPRLGARRLQQWQEEQRRWPHEWLTSLSESQRHYFEYLRHPTGHQRILQPLAQWCDEAPSRALLHPGHPDWPALLTQLPDPPPVLWAWGSLHCMSMPCVAVVGTRHPSSSGLRYAHAFSRALAEAGSCIVSGMALGIDAQAHEGALAAGGATIAVLGCGLEHTYPRQHADLQQRILSGGGLLLSEHPPSVLARPAFFPRRNRIITGLSAGVLVIEAMQRSGSLISARLALEQNRDVFALPGAPEAALSAGCHQLIRQGAVLVTSPADIISDLGGPWRDALEDNLLSTTSSSARSNDTHKKQPISESRYQRWSRLLQHGPMSLDALVQLSHSTVTDTLNALLALELEGHVVSCADGWTLLSPSSESSAQTR